MNVVPHILNTEAVKKHMSLKSMSTKGSHLNPFFFVYITEYLLLEIWGTLVFKYDSPQNDKNKCFIPLVTAKVPLINDFYPDKFNSPK